MSLDCLVTFQETISQTESGVQSDFEHLACIPIINGRESELLYRLDGIPLSFTDTHNKALYKGELYITLRDAVIMEEHSVIHVLQQTSFEVCSSPPITERPRRLETTGDFTIAYVRVTMSNARVSQTADEIRNKVTGNGVNMMSHLAENSFGKLNVQPAGTGVYEVSVDNKIGSYERGFNTHNDVRQAIVDQLNVAEVRDLADKGQC